MEFGFIDATSLNNKTTKMQYILPTGRSVDETRALDNGQFDHKPVLNWTSGGGSGEQRDQ